MEAELFYPELAAGSKPALLHYLASVCSDRLISGMDFSLPASFTAGIFRRTISRDRVVRALLPSPTVSLLYRICVVPSFVRQTFDKHSTHRVWQQQSAL
jgi:hypothetical protein